MSINIFVSSATSSVGIVTPTTEMVFVFFFPLIVQFLGFCLVDFAINDEIVSHNYAI